MIPVEDFTDEDDVTLVSDDYYNLVNLLFFRICTYAHMGIFGQIYPYGHIWPNMPIWAYGHMRKKIWPRWVSPKRASKMQLRHTDLKSVGHSSQKFWPKPLQNGLKLYGDQESRRFQPCGTTPRKRSHSNLQPLEQL